MDIRVRNNDTVNHTWGGKEFTPDEIYQIQLADYDQFLTDSTLFSSVGIGDASIGNLDGFYDNPIEGWEYLEHGKTDEVTTTGEVVVTWSQLKAFYNSTKPSTRMFYIDLTTHYYVWLSITDHKIYVPVVEKGTADSDDFEDNFKALCNIPEAFLTRITTCRVGNTLHERYISFTTSSQDSYDNTDYNNVNIGDIVYTMKKWVSGSPVTTTVNSECEETWIDWEPSYDIEIMGGLLDVPTELSGSNDNAWEVHIVAAPDVPVAYGGCIQLVTNPRLKWSKGRQIGVDAALNPKVIKYDPVYHSGKIRTILKHPAGAQTEFQLNFKVFRR